MNIFADRFFLLFCLLGLWLLASDRSFGVGVASPLGQWKNEDATFEVFENEGKLSGRIVDLKEPLREGKPKVDIHNSDPSKRSRPIMGMVFMYGFGTIYDPKSGNTYSCTMELDGPDKLKVRGYIGISLIGRTDVWTRVK
jgi:Uncharacterized protein conserved in bacteria (DUF2147)